ncbi:DUF418 domain-containing protein [Microbacteriaceae bacterium 4G12]
MNTSIQQNERIQAMDVIRGIAILGIFLVNWPTIVGVEAVDVGRVYTGWNAYIRLFYDLFIQTKFYTIFSFLFGLGFYIFITRAEEKTKRPKLLFLRRLFILLVFGSLHYILLWRGDILHSYALAGVFLLLFYRRKPKTVLIWSFVLLALFQLLMVGAFSMMNDTNTGVTVMAATTPLYHWTEQVATRFQAFKSEAITLNLILLPETVGLFLLGLYVGKKNIFRRASQLDSRLKTIQIIALLLTLPSWFKILQYFVATKEYNSAQIYLYVLLSGKTLCIFYITTLLRFMQHPKWQRLLRPFQYVGRMALTNYLSQTLITSLFFSLFFRDSANLPLWVGIVFCLCFYFIQIIWSKWWLSRYQYGPLEYIWRIGTYGKKMPLRQKQAS